MVQLEPFKSSRDERSKEPSTEPISYIIIFIPLGFDINNYLSDKMVDCMKRETFDITKVR